MKFGARSLIVSLLCLAAALAVGLYCHSGGAPDRHCRCQPAVSQRPSRENTRPIPQPTGGGRRPAAGAATAAAAKSPWPLPASVDGPTVISNEWQLRFASREAMAKFLEQAGGRPGAAIIDYDDTLLSVRIKVGSREVLARLERQLDSRPLAISPNHRFSLPATTVSPADLPVRASYRPYGGQALAGLGIREGSNGDWGRGVTVALIDTGIRNPELFAAGQVAAIDLLADDNGDEDATAAAWHGTAMASIIGSQDERLPGVAPAVSLLDIRALDDQGRGDGFTLARGIITAVDNGADIINLSVGGLDDDLALRLAIDYAQENGVTVVAAAGNEGAGQLDYPARYPGVVAVGAVDAAGQHPDFSNSGGEIDLAAPGYGVYTALGSQLYARLNGTSAAAAFVSGAIAGVMSEEGLDAPAATGLVICFAVDLGHPGRDFSFGIGLVNLDRIRDRFTAYDDLATAGYFWQPPASAAADRPANPRLAVSVQNRGTTDIWDVDVVVRINGAARRYRLDSLAPGESQSITTGLSLAELQQLGSAAVKVAVSAPGIDDRHPENNLAAFYLSR
ncbi:MAG: S8 family serine peptidase [Deltaproteobacteria bacterium]|nr:S8 family serine peptidase [Deltaproteobacteria bacterium]